MEARIENFEVESGKINTDKKIVTLADLHLSLSLNKKILETIKIFLDTNRKSVSLIAMPGDIMYAANYKNAEYVRRLQYLLESLSEMETPIALSLGNHDLQSDPEDTKKAFKALENIEHIYPLDNEKVRIDGMTVAGFSPDHDVYKPSWHGDKANEAFVEQFLSSGLTFSDDELNILLNHAPHPIASDYAQE